MVIWLSQRRHAAVPEDGRLRFGVHDDIVPRETFGALTELKAAYDIVERDSQVALAAAHEEAARIIAVAQAKADWISAEARRIHEAAAERGFEEGMAKGVADWFASVASAGGEARALQDQMRSRMAEIVAAAVEQIVRAERVSALFERALSAVDGIVEGSTYLRVAVHPEDLDEAKAAFDGFAARWRELGRPLPLTVSADHRLARGSCLCESDLGFIDASVTTQLLTMRAAISRALNNVATGGMA